MLILTQSRGALAWSCFVFRSFEISNLFRISIFEFRISIWLRLRMGKKETTGLKALPLLMDGFVKTLGGQGQARTRR